MPSGWNQTGGYTGITSGSRELGGQNWGVQGGPNRFLTPDLTTPEA